jgi:uncharacterized membrane protein YqgA involved in biofilm formation
MSKAHALLAGLGAVVVFGLLAFILPGRAESMRETLTAIVSLCGLYIGLQVANNGVRGKCFNRELYDAEHAGGSE